MKTTDLVLTAVSNTFRSKTRTLLTILAIFVGAFTLTLTSGLGTGINRYLDDTVAGVGASNSMTVTKPAESSSDGGLPSADASTPQKYDPDAIAAGDAGAAGMGATVQALTPSDIDAIGKLAGVESVQATRTLSTDFIQAGDGTGAAKDNQRYQVSVASLGTGQSAVFSAGVAPDDASKDAQIALPDAYLESLGFSDANDAVGKTVTLGITDANRKQHTLTATITGVSEEALASPLGTSAIINETLSNELFSAQSTGLTDAEAQRYASATVYFADGTSDAGIQDLKDALSAAGYTGTTVADRLGMVTTVINGMVLVLNGFAVIALLAAAFGIVNTLFMSVQERRKEIGLMKAMGMGSGRVFGLFSLEAAFLGLLGSAIGAGIAMLAGTGLSSVLSRTLLSDLPGLHLIAFSATSVGSIIALVVVIAFLAGTLPAARAAKADPVESLRQE